MDVLVSAGTAMVFGAVAVAPYLRSLAAMSGDFIVPLVVSFMAQVSNAVPDAYSRRLLLISRYL